MLSISLHPDVYFESVECVSCVSCVSCVVVPSVVPSVAYAASVEFVEFVESVSSAEPGLSDFAVCKYLGGIETFSRILKKRSLG